MTVQKKAYDIAGTVRSLFKTACRAWLRKRKIAYRNSLDSQCRDESSCMIISRLRQLPEYKAAKNILLYAAVNGEITLRGLRDDGKHFAFPLCISKTEMAALVPEDDKAWHSGYCGIAEPIRDRSEELLPEELDLVICPCTVFDKRCNRMGMGGGFYDRYLPQCKNAAVIAVAYEGQRTAFLPTERWDVPMDKVVTEKHIYCRVTH